MARIVFTVSDQMQIDLKAEADKRGATVSNLIRQYIAQGLSQNTGKSVEEYAVHWGGKRDTEQEIEG